MEQDQEEQDLREAEAQDVAGIPLLAVVPEPGWVGEAPDQARRSSAPNAEQKHPRSGASPASSRNALNAEAPWQGCRKRQIG